MVEVKQVEKIGEFLTLREAARMKSTTPNALYLWMRDRNVPRSKLGNTILVKQSDIVGYTRIWNTKKQ